MRVAESIVYYFIAFSDPSLRSCLKSRAAVFMNETFFLFTSSRHSSSVCRSRLSEGCPSSDDYLGRIKSSFSFGVFPLQHLRCNYISPLMPCTPALSIITAVPISTRLLAFWCWIIQRFRCPVLVTPTDHLFFRSPVPLSTSDHLMEQLTREKPVCSNFIFRIEKWCKFFCCRVRGAPDVSLKRT